MKQNAFNNATWIIGCKIVQSIIAFIIGMLTARYLGPSNYGLISYAAAIVAFFVPIMKLGFNNTLVQEIVYEPENEGKAVGTSLVLCFIASIASIVGVVSFALIFNAKETETIMVCFLYSLTLICQVGEMLQYWFQAKLFAKYSSVASLIAYILVSFYKVYILIAGKNVRWFVITHALEALIISVLLLVIYKKIGNKKLLFSWNLGKRMFAKSRYYIGSGVVLVLFQQIDSVMLKLMSGETETGYYSVASTSVCITAFVFAAVIESIRPSIFESKKNSHKEYENRMVLLFSIVFFLSLAQCVGMTLLAKPMVLIMYGNDYMPAITVLQLLVWNIIFSYLGLVVRNVWILSEEKQNYLWLINLSGVLLNIVINAVLIPICGANGAAIATVISQFFANIIMSVILKPMRPTLKLIYKSMNLKVLFKALESLRKSYGK